MKIKRILPFLPAALLPYLFLLSLIVIRFGVSFLDLFGEYALLVIVGFWVLILIAAVIAALVAFFSNITAKNPDAVSLAKWVMCIKLAQIPAYLVIFVLGILFAIMPFLFIGVLLMIIVDWVTIFASGLLGAAAVVMAVREGKWSASEAVAPILLQFLFCVDVFASVWFYLKVRKRAAVI